jgi:hypothetical protein
MSSRAKDVVVLCWNAPAQADDRAHRIATFLGAKATFVALDSAAVSEGAAIRDLVPASTCLVVAAETLASAVDAAQSGVEELADAMTDVADYVFVYGFEPTERHAAVLRALSSGALAGIQPPAKADSAFHVAAHSRQWCSQFAGLSFGSADPARDQRFVEGQGKSLPDTLIRVDREPFFARINRGRGQVFFVASGELADLNETVGRHARLLAWFSRLAPLMMFLRGALGDRLWQNDAPRACLTIDDPLLTSRYGFLTYERLIEAMRRREFSTSIAFIPWNYRRSQHDVAALLTSNPNAPSLCVHGCDHIDGEFAVPDFDELHQKAQLALERMHTHHRLSGVPFDDVMVFPQGRFSVEAVTALRATGYLATANGDVCPANSPVSLILQNWLEVAVTRFSDFPLFGRRYPGEIAEFAFDLFLGKPALAVEHHRYFENGYGELESFVDRLKALDHRLEWSSLGTICSRACLTKSGDAGQVHVRFYTHSFTLTNRGRQPTRYVLFRNQPDATRPLSVTVDGREHECERAGDDVMVALSLEPGATATIVVSSDRTSSVGAPWKASSAHHINVRARRILGEFRDNYVDTTRVLLTRFIGGRGQRSQKAAPDVAAPSRQS